MGPIVTRCAARTSLRQCRSVHVMLTQKYIRGYSADRGRLSSRDSLSTYCQHMRVTVDNTNVTKAYSKLLCNIGYVIMQSDIKKAVAVPLSSGLRACSRGPNFHGLQWLLTGFPENIPEYYKTARPFFVNSPCVGCLL